MTTPYYHLSPVILQDNLFFSLQPECVVTGTFAQRQVAYGIAEQQMIRHIMSPLLPTTLTGTFLWPQPYGPVMLDFVNVQAIKAVVGLSFDDACSCDLTPYAGCASIRSSLGYIDPRIIEGIAARACGCGGPGWLYQVRVAYTAGLPTGVAANHGGLHAALSMVAAQALKEIADPGSNEGGPGAPGITSWSAQGYSESRVEPVKSAFGKNALTTYAANLVEDLKPRRALRM